jgi:Flp pilus assembly protein TadG
MKKIARFLAADPSGNAAVEMALVAPLLLIIMFGSVELGNYFMNEHSLVKAVRDGARYAARQGYTNWPDCSTVNTTVRDNTRLAVKTGYLTSSGGLGGGPLLTPNITSSDITVSVSCFATAGGQNMLGIYRSRFGGTCNGSSSNGCAQVVTVTAAVPYRSILGVMGFTGIGMNLNASSQAVVTGI